MYSTILIPTDGSSCATQALDHGLKQAARHDADVHLLYVLDTNRGPESDWDVVVERQEAQGERVLEEGLKRAHDAGYSATPHLRRGRPSEEICRAASEYGADLVVMGTCGRSGLDRILRPGSTTERVIQNCGCPVTVIPPAVDPSD